MRKDQYQCMSDLQDSLRKLYGVISYSPEEIFIESPKGIVQALAFANRGMPANYIEQLAEQAKEAIRILEGNQIGCWKEKEDQKELEKKVESYGKSIKSYEEKIGKQSEKIAELEGRIRDYESSTARDAEKEMRDMIGNVIALRDGQLMKRDYLRSQGMEEGSAALRIVEATLKEIGNLLKKSGVEILEDQGAFSSQRQTIVDVKETEEESLDGQIAEIVRPGYVYQGEQLRGQEVIVYKRKE